MKYFVALLWPHSASPPWRHRRHAGEADDAPGLALIGILLIVERWRSP